MSMVPHRSRPRLRAVPRCADGAASSAEEIKIARQRMRNLVPWNVEPLPVMHSVAGTPSEPLTREARERNRRLALQVLAVHMWHASATSALQ